MNATVTPPPVDGVKPPAPKTAVPKALTGSLELTNMLGMRLHVAVGSMDEAYGLMRQYGTNGWTSGEIPNGGLMLPYAMADKFDWRLIGAREFTFEATEEDGTKTTKHAVSYRGLIYKRRDLPAGRIKGKPVPAMTKYSRGAKDFDGAEAREGDAGGIEYITLATFRGNGPVIPTYCKPA